MSDKIKKNLMSLLLMFFPIFSNNYCYAVAVGELYGGGTVFCVSQTPDITQCVPEGSGDYGLIMANEDQANFDSNPNHGVTWSSERSETGALSDDDGAANTATIIAAFPKDNPSNNAAWLCRNYRDPIERHEDWYLPSKNELNKMYIYAKAHNLIGRGWWGSRAGGVQYLVGGAYSNDKLYWSSSEHPGDSGYYGWLAWGQYFSFGGQVGSSKVLDCFGVRAVRAFNNSLLNEKSEVIDNLMMGVYLKNIIPSSEYPDVYELALKITNKRSDSVKILDILPPSTSDNTKFHVVLADISECNKLGFWTREPKLDAGASCSATATIFASPECVVSSMAIDVWYVPKDSCTGILAHSEVSLEEHVHLLTEIAQHPSANTGVLLAIAQNRITNINVLNAIFHNPNINAQIVEAVIAHHNADANLLTEIIAWLRTDHAVKTLNLSNTDLSTLIERITINLANCHIDDKRKDCEDACKKELIRMRSVVRNEDREECNTKIKKMQEGKLGRANLPYDDIHPVPPPPVDYLLIPPEAYKTVENMQNACENACRIELMRMRSVVRNEDREKCNTKAMEMQNKEL